MSRIKHLFRVSFVFLTLSVCPSAFAAEPTDVARWEAQAQNVTVVRDDWGIAHVFGKTDADAVFGALYAQAEDDFNRIETNYLNGMGRLAEAEGESRVYQDLRMKLFIDPAAMKTKYAASPAWLQALMTAFADGLNFYLYKHPDVKPRVLTRFEPWMALTFSEGSIGGDIESVDLGDLQKFYGRKRDAPASTASTTRPTEPGGSNGMAIAPSRTTNGHALFLINPHTSFYFRSELSMVSEEGLHAYGAATWGQLFIYQGFNEHVGWMHTSSGVDAIDEFMETVQKKGKSLVYKYGDEERPVEASVVTVPFKTAKGMSKRTFTTYRTHHGPIVREAGGKWVSVALMNDPVKALTQSFTRIKARDYKSFKETMELHTNSSNNTIFASADGDIAYLHGNFIPRRDARFDYSKPVDGSDPATDWHGLLSFDESPNILNPESGWLYNSNDAPWTAAGPSSPKKKDYPAYVENGGESARGLHAVKVLENRKDFTLESLIAAAYDSYMPWFEKPLPALVAAWDALPSGDPLRAKLEGPIGLLRAWDLRWSATSVPTALAVFWGEDLEKRVASDAKKADMSATDYARLGKASGDAELRSLAAAVDKLAADFGTWKTPWGDINRFQRLTGDIVQPFRDAGPSIPVPFTRGEWGSLASFEARARPGTKKRYGTSGNSFVAAVEFGPKVRAKAVTAGGESGDPRSKHFKDEAPRYAAGDLRDVYFYREDLAGHTEREYHPGR